MTRTLALLFAVCGLCLCGLGVHAAGAGMGVGAVPAGGPAADAKKEPVEAVGYEPWMKSAKVGDYIVQKFTTGITTRREVKEIAKDFLILEVESTANGKKVTSLYKHPFGIKLLPSEGVPDMEVDIKHTSSGSTEIGGKTVKYAVYDGFFKGMRSTTSGPDGKIRSETYKAIPYQKVVGEGVPCGGLLKVSRAKDDGRSLEIGSGRLHRVENRIKTLEPRFEVVAFGNTADEAAAKAAAEAPPKGEQPAAK